MKYNNYYDIVTKYFLFYDKYDNDEDRMRDFFKRHYGLNVNVEKWIELPRNLRKEIRHNYYYMFGGNIGPFGIIKGFVKKVLFSEKYLVNLLLPTLGENYTYKIEDKKLHFLTVYEFYKTYLPREIFKYFRIVDIFTLHAFLPFKEFVRKGYFSEDVIELFDIPKYFPFGDYLDATEEAYEIAKLYEEKINYLLSNYFYFPVFRYKRDVNNYFKALNNREKPSSDEFLKSVQFLGILTNLNDIEEESVIFFHKIISLMNFIVYYKELEKRGVFEEDKELKDELNIFE